MNDTGIYSINMKPTQALLGRYVLCHHIVKIHFNDNVIACFLELNCLYGLITCFLCFVTYETHLNQLIF